MILYNNQLVETTYFELKSMPVKPGSPYHDEPADIPRGQGYCVFCGTKTRLQCWRCLLELKDVFPVCPTSVRDCFQKMHEMRNEIWISRFGSNVFEKYAWDAEWDINISFLAKCVWKICQNCSLHKIYEEFMNAKYAKDLCFFTPPNPQLSRQTQGEKPQIMYGR